MTDEAAPARADVEQAVAGLQAQLAADHLELVALGGCDVVLPIREIGARIDHLGVEKEGIELVREVVVKLDEGLVVAAASGRGR